MAIIKDQSSASINNIYSLDGKVPILKSIPFGLQHVLAMFVANIAPIMIVTSISNLSMQETASLIQTAMIIAGILLTVAYIISGRGENKLNDAALVEGLATFFYGFSVINSQVSETTLTLFFGTWRS